MFYDSFALKIHMNNQAFDPDQFPDEYMLTHCWSLNVLQKGKLNAMLIILNLYSTTNSRFKYISRSLMRAIKNTVV